MERINSILKWPVKGAVDSQSAGISGVIAQANTALKTINTPKSGTLSMLDDTILQGRLTIDAVNKVTIHEQNQLSTLDGDIAETFGNANATLVTLNGTLTTANGSIADLTRSANGVLDTTNTTIGAAQPVLGRATLFVGHADDLVVQAQPIVTNTAEITKQGAIIAKDAKVEEQKYVYAPKTPWYKKIIPTALKAGELVYDFIR